MTGPSYPPHSISRKVGTTGNFGYAGKLIPTGYRYAGAKVRVIPIGELIHVYYGERLIRTLTLDPDRYYQLMPRQTSNVRRPTNTTRADSVR